MGIQNLTSKPTKPTQKTKFESEPPKSRKRPKCAKINPFLRMRIFWPHFGRFLDLGGSDFNSVFFAGLVSSLAKF